jgi:hypothetical protein
VPLVEVFRHLVRPGRPVGFDAALEQFPERDYEIARRFVPRPVGPADERAQVTHDEVVAQLDGRFGPIAPLGRLHARNERFRQGQDTFGARLRPALFTRPFTFEVQGRAHRRDAPPQQLLSYGLLLDGQAFEHGIAVGVSRVEPLLPRLRRAPLWAFAAIGATAGRPLALRSTVSPARSGGSRGPSARPGPRPGLPRGPVGAVRPLPVGSLSGGTVAVAGSWPSAVPIGL